MTQWTSQYHDSHDMILDLDIWMDPRISDFVWNSKRRHATGKVANAQHLGDHASSAGATPRQLLMSAPTTTRTQMLQEYIQTSHLDDVMLQ